MLRDSWYIKQKSHGKGKTDWHFQCSKDEDYMILVLADTESEAWEKLGTLLGKDDKENVETEVLEGVVYAYKMGNLRVGDIESSSRETFAVSLVKHEGKRVKVTMEIKG